MKKNRICINASNLHTGGAVQVATSFISEIYKNLNEFEIENLTIYASSVVNENLIEQGVDTKKIKNYEVLDVFGMRAMNFKLLRKFNNFDCVFSVFGPFYLPRKIKNHIVGFAQPWILNPDNEISQKIDFLNEIKTKLKFKIQWVFFKFSADRLVVELPHVMRRLVDFRKYPSEKIDVVENCFSSIYLDEKKWIPFSRISEKNEDVIRLGYVSRAYLHKNLQVLLPVAKALEKMTSIRFEFFVTLNDAEWKACSVEYRDVVRNVGVLSVAQCPSFYRAMDGIIFTSLLECFSATPLEALVMRKPLFASDRDFVRDVCLKHATYVDPLDPNDIARKILTWYEKKKAEKELLIESAYGHVMNLPKAHDRALAYWKIIKYQLEI